MIKRQLQPNLQEQTMKSRHLVVLTPMALVCLLGTVLVATSKGAASSTCAQAQAARVPGLSDYLVATCCSKGCGGKCCRCGSAVGYKPGCTDRCSVANSESDAIPVSLPAPIRLRGRLVHVESGIPLANELVSFKMPGRAPIVARSGSDGIFILETSNNVDAKFIIVDVGDHRG
jgi:hypothetical protein